jgi:hypothetical protein
MQLTLKNIHLHYIMVWLQTPLHGDFARARNKFLKVISPIVGELTKDRNAIIESNCRRGDDGKPVINPDKTYDVLPERREQNEKDVNALYEKSVVISDLDKAVVKNMRVTFKNLPKAMSIEEGRAYDELMEILEAIK